MPTRNHYVTLHFDEYTLVFPKEIITISVCGDCRYCVASQNGVDPCECSHPHAPQGHKKRDINAYFMPPDWCPGRK